MTDQDAYAEAIAQIRTSVDSAAAERAAREAEAHPAPRTGPEPPRVSFGSPSRRWAPIRELERSLAHENPMFHGLEVKLRQFLAATFPKTATVDALSSNIMVRSPSATQINASYSPQVDVHECVYADYNSLEDFRMAQDILRCTPRWNRRDARYDCVLLDADTAPEVARLCLLMRCKLMATLDVLDVAAITRFTTLPGREWRPQTTFRGCRLYKEGTELNFIDPLDISRAAYTCPAFQGPVRIHYLLDSVGGGDMFLRLNDLAAPLHLHEPVEPVELDAEE